MALSDDKLWDLWNAQGTDNMSKEEAFVFARAIEAEVRRLHAENADRAARAPADSVTAPAATPTAASIAWTALRDLTDPLGEAGVKIMGHVRIYAQRQYEAGLTEGRATPPAQAADSVPAMSDAARDLLAERARQVQEEGWTPEHDDEHSCGEMAEAAACYAASARVPTSTKRRQCPGYWPWAAKWWKPSDQRRDLIKAGALILAELERIDRAASKQGANHD